MSQQNAHPAEQAQDGDGQEEVGEEAREPEIMHKQWFLQQTPVTLQIINPSN